MKKITSEVIATVMITFALLSFDVTRNLVYTRAIPQTIFQAGLVGLTLGVGIAKKFLGMLPILATETVIYWTVTWTVLPVSTIIISWIAPIFGVIAAIIILVKVFTDDDN